jgi:hypothetical protein
MSVFLWHVSGLICPSSDHITSYIVTLYDNRFDVTMVMLGFNPIQLSTCVDIILHWYIEQYQGKDVPLWRAGDKGERKYSSYSFFGLGTRLGWVVNVTPLPRFSPGVRTPGTHCTGGWLGPRAGLDTEARGKSFASSRDRTLVVQSAVRHYTDWATPAPALMYIHIF